MEVEHGGKKDMVSCGRYIKIVFHQIVMKSISIHRLLFECFDDTYFGKEKEILNNSTKLREFIKAMIHERRE